MNPRIKKILKRHPAFAGQGSGNPGTAITPRKESAKPATFRPFQPLTGQGSNFDRQILHWKDRRNPKAQTNRKTPPPTPSGNW